MIRLIIYLKDGREFSGTYNLPMFLERVIEGCRSGAVAAFYWEAA